MEGGKIRQLRSVASQFKIGKSTLRAMVVQVCQAIKAVICPCVVVITQIPEIIEDGFPNCEGHWQNIHAYTLPTKRGQWICEQQRLLFTGSARLSGSQGSAGHRKSPWRQGAQKIRNVLQVARRDFIPLKRHNYVQHFCDDIYSGGPHIPSLLVAQEALSWHCWSREKGNQLQTE